MTFRSHPDPSQWDDYVDFESTSWPKKDRRHYWIIPSICFNCESACGILAYVDKEAADRPQDRGQSAASRAAAAVRARRASSRRTSSRIRIGSSTRSTATASADRESGGRCRGTKHWTTSPGPHPEGDRREPAARNHVSRRPARRGRLREPRPAGVGRRRPQQPHQRLLLVRAPRTLPLVRQRSPVAGLRQRADDPAALVAPRDRPLLQPARAAHHRRPGQRRHAHRDRSAALEHVRESQPVAAGVFRARRARCCWRW